MASPIPVLPLVGSTIVPPGLSAPVRSASSIIASAMRSFTLPPGLRDSTLATTAAPPGLGSLRRRTRGVPPMSSSTESWIVMGLSIKCGTSDVVHRPRAAPPLARLRHQFAERHPIDHLRDGLGNLEPELREVGGGVGLKRRASPLHRAQDRPDRDVARIPRQMVPAGGAALGNEEPGALERQEYLLEIALRNRLPLGDLLDGNQSALALQREIEHRLDRVLAFGGDSHRPLLSARPVHARAAARPAERST